MTFEECIRQCLADRELVAEFDRLTSSNLSLAGDVLSVQIDIASGRAREDIRLFTLFVYDSVWLRCREIHDD